MAPLGHHTSDIKKTQKKQTNKQQKKRKNKKKKRKREKVRCVLFPLLVRFRLWIISFSFSWFVKQHGIQDIKVTGNTRTIRCRWRVNYIYELINYIMEQNLFANVEQFPVKHVALRFSGRKNVTHKREWHMDELISQVQVLPIFYPEVPCATLCWPNITL